MTPQIAAALAEEVVAAIAEHTQIRDRLREALGIRSAEATPAVYTTKTLALELGVTEETIRRAIRRRELAATRRGKAYVIPRAAVEEWATSGEAKRRGPARGMPAGRRGTAKPLRSALDDIARGE